MVELPECNILTAGFPCQDLSQAGPLAGINGAKSGLVQHVFRLLDDTKRCPEWIVFENVPFTLNLKQGAGIAWLVDQLEQRHFRWAYRVVDSRAFGLPQRRRRLFIVASRENDPCKVLFKDDASPGVTNFDGTQPCGFYWTEGNTGLGWAVDAVPPLKGSSGLGIVSPPGIWLPTTQEIVTPSITAAEQLQGFDAEWTRAADEIPRGERLRWKLVGNAVSPPVAAWLGRSMLDSAPVPTLRQVELSGVFRWPKAAWGAGGKRFAVEVSEWPVAVQSSGLAAVLAGRANPLSLKAAKGFYTRLVRSTLRVPEEFKRDLGAYIEQGAPGDRREEPAVRKYAGER